MKGRRGGFGGSKLSHSLKKMLRRQTSGLVKAKKAKSRDPIHPGHKLVTVNAKRRQERAEGNEEGDEAKTKVRGVASGTEKRAEVRKALGKQARLEETARRRGILPSATAGQDMAPPSDDEEDPDAVAAANQAARRALSFAPSNQRAFHKELSTVLKSADVLLEVLDARDPMGCRCIPLEDAVLAKCRGKRVVLILNKVDLVPADVTQRWLTYLRQYFPTLPFKAATQHGGAKREIAHASRSGAVGKLDSYSGEAYGGDGLLQLLKNYSRSVGMKTAITVGIVGYPNVGKSSLINSLKRAKAANVGATPGVTTVAQTIALDSKVKLMDCPGIIFARASGREEQADVLLRNCVRVEQLEDPTLPVEAILRRCPAEQLMRQYDVAAFSGADEFLTLVAAKRGHLRKGGAADQNAAARAVLQDWNAGVIRYHTEPPKPTGGVALVDTLADNFDWDAAPRVEQEEDADLGGEAPKIATTSAGGQRSSSGVAMADVEGMTGDGNGVDAAPRLAQGWAQAHERDPSKKKKPEKRAPTKRNVNIASGLDADERYNFQHNKGIRKAQVADKKKQRRLTAARMMLA